MTRRKLLSVVSVVMLLFSLAPTWAASAQAPAAASRTLQLGLHGVTRFNPSPSAAGPDQDTPLDRALMLRQAALERDVPRGGAPSRPSVIPPAASSPLMSAASTRLSFDGLKHFDQRFANGGNQFSLEPPDQALCVGGGFVLQAVNDVMKVYNTSGASLSGVQDLNSFFGLPAQIDRGTGVIGPFLSDPKCYHDSADQRWFLTELMIDNGANPGATGRAFTMIAVSQTADPTGAWFLYALDATNDGLNGTPSHTGCPCFGDQPLLGADANGIYLSTNEFSLSGPGFNGAQLYALPKTALAAGADTFAVLFDNLLLAEGQAYSVQPATYPVDYAKESFGIEYAMSALDFTGAGDTRIAAWAVLNTESLGGFKVEPNLVLVSTVISSEAYAMPPLAAQRNGSTPLRDSFGDADALATLNTNDDRMNQTIFSHSMLWAGLNTALTVDGVQQAGIAWFAVRPQFVGGLGNLGLRATLEMQGYIGLRGSDLSYPSIGVTAGGLGVMGMTVSGASRFPSAGYVKLTGGDPSVRLAAAGVEPEDGFTGYPSIAGGSGAARWGDYSAAVVDGESVWIANEYIGQTCAIKTFSADPTCGGTRSFYANWDTRISQVTP